MICKDCRIMKEIEYLQLMCLSNKNKGEDAYVYYYLFVLFYR